VLGSGSGAALCAVDCLVLAILLERQRQRGQLGQGRGLELREQREDAHRLHRTSHRIASHRIASHRIASHRIASHRIASHRIASHA
jgi:hypothetical protein